MYRVLKPLWVLLALVFLVEAWLWEHLSPLVGWLVARIPWRALKAAIAARVAALSPVATLPVFLIPVALLVPIKVLGLWFLAHGAWLPALLLLLLAKLVGLGVTAFLFDLTRPKLLELAWFATLYRVVLAGLAWAHAQIDPIKLRIRQALAETLAPIVRRLRAGMRLLLRRRAGRGLRLLLRIRRRMQAAPVAQPRARKESR